MIITNNTGNFYWLQTSSSTANIGLEPSGTVTISNQNYLHDTTLRARINNLFKEDNISVSDEPDGFPVLLEGEEGSDKHKTVFVTTDETYAAEYIFEFSGVSVTYVKATLVTVTADDETFGEDNLYVKVSTIDSRDGEAFDSAVAVELTPYLFEEGDEAGMTAFSSKYTKVVVELLNADDDDEPYSGDNMPVVHVRLDVEHS